MSILIKGMEMPKDGDWVNVNICSDGSVYFIKSASNGFVFYGVQKGEAIEIPPHGRLIDADALVADLKRQCKEVFKTDAVSPDDFWITRNQAYNERLWTTWCESMFDYLKTIPTIIQAEEGET